ncbi:MAG: flagellar hook-basal body complex protein [Lachnospiraceae bacterium]|nr:flagellar hook-basal body complex protein [Lachnospiraceae bacterium]
MMRSLFSGVSGLKTHQTRMDVIGNNIANVNTVGYKSASMSFQELMYQNTSYAASADNDTGRGGINANQIGLGVRAGAISNSITTQGAAQTTNDPFDLRIEGDSFFIVNNGSGNYYTRAGAFYVDGAGNLAMKTTGYNVMGWQADEDGNLASDLSALKVMAPENMTSNPEATTYARVLGILDKDGAKLNAENGGQAVDIQVYDDLGYSYTCKFKITPQKDPVTGNNIDGKYTIVLEDIIDSKGDTLGASNFLHDVENTNGAYDPDSDAFDKSQIVFGDSVVGTQQFSIEKRVKDATTTYVVTNKNGTTETFTEASEATAYFNKLTGEKFTIADVEALADNTPSVKEYRVYGYTGDTGLLYNTTDGSLKSIGGMLKEVNMNLSQIGGKDAFKDVTVDFSPSSNKSNGGVPTIEGKAGDAKGHHAGKKVGKMISLSVDSRGQINATYDNGNSRVLGMIATATFANASGLEKQGENLYAASLNSGEASVQEIAANGEKMSNGTLEMSNVDLSTEFTEMITTQRGFQANSRIITTSDTLLEELVNLKR